MTHNPFEIIFALIENALLQVEMQIHYEWYVHTINSKLIERKGYDVSKYIPEDLINYYKTLNFWK